MADTIGSFSGKDWQRERVSIGFEERELTEAEKADAIVEFIDDGDSESVATTKVENSIYRRPVVDVTGYKLVRSGTVTNTIYNNYIDADVQSDPEQMDVADLIGGELPDSGFDVWLLMGMDSADLIGGGNCHCHGTWRGYGQWVRVIIETATP